MVDVRGDVLRPPHGTTPAAVKANKIQAGLYKQNWKEMEWFQQGSSVHEDPLPLELYKILIVFAFIYLFKKVSVFIDNLKCHWTPGR